MKLCECGCGRSTAIILLTDTRKGRIKGEYNRFVTGHNNRGKRGHETSRWNGGRTIHQSGYLCVRTPCHPRASNSGYVFEHILVAEKALGRYLPPKAVVHHANEKKDDNRNCNLVICENEAYHRLLHQRARAYQATGSIHGVRCYLCGTWGTPEDIPGKRGGSRFHETCGKAFEKEQSRKRRQKKTRPDGPLT